MSQSLYLAYLLIYCYWSLLIDLYQVIFFLSKYACCNRRVLFPVT